MRKIIIRAIIKMVFSVIIQIICFTAYLFSGFCLQLSVEAGEISIELACVIVVTVILVCQLLLIPVYKIKPLKSETKPLEIKILKALFWIFNASCAFYMIWRIIG